MSRLTFSGSFGPTISFWVVSSIRYRLFLVLLDRWAHSGLFRVYSTDCFLSFLIGGFILDCFKYTVPIVSCHFGSHGHSGLFRVYGTDYFLSFWIGGLILDCFEYTVPIVSCPF